MKVRELIEQLEDYEDFDIEAAHMEIDESKEGYAALKCSRYTVEGVGDIGYSEKTIVLDVKER